MVSSPKGLKFFKNFSIFSPKCGLAVAYNLLDIASTSLHIGEGNRNDFS